MGLTYEIFLVGTSDISWPHMRLTRPRTLLPLAHSSSGWVAQDSWSVTTTPRSDLVKDAQLWPESCWLCWGAREDLFLVIFKILHLVLLNFLPWSVLQVRRQSIGRKSLLSSANRAIWTHADLVYISGNFKFSFVSTSLACITISKNKRKTNTTWNKKN